MATSFELFHVIADASSARVRRYLVDHELGQDVTLRNIHYPEANAAFVSHGGQQAPALWDGERLHVGADAIIARLVAFSDVGRNG